MSEEGTQAGLLEREHQLTVIERNLGEALAGSGCVVVVEGSAGVGKSSLIRALALEARAKNATVLTATGGELEREFPFGLVRQLLEPVMVGAGEERRAQLLSGAAAAAGPVLGAAPDPSGDSADTSFAVLHGIYWLVASLAEEQPLVMCVDDIHWSDPASLRLVDFLGRRVSELPVMIVLGLRPNEPGASLDLVDSIVSGSGAEIVEPRPLTREAVQILMADRLDDPSSDVTDAAHASTGGNPLLLRELIRGLEGRPELSAEAIREIVPASVTRSVERRIGRLSADGRQTVGELAVLGDGARAMETLRLVSDLGDQALLAAIDELRLRELIEGDPPRFSHPLVRQAVGETVPSAERMRLHARAAEAMRGKPGMEEQLITHLLAAPPVGEEWAIVALREGGRRAFAEGAPEASVRRLRRAIEEAGAGHSDHSRIALELAEAEIREGEWSGIDRLVALARDPELEIAARASGIFFGLGYTSEELRLTEIADQGFDLLARLRDGHTDAHDELAAHMLSLLILEESGNDPRRRLIQDLRPDPPAGALAAIAFNDACEGANPGTVRAMVERFQSEAPVADVVDVEQPKLFWALEAANGIDAPDLGRSLIDSAERVVRTGGSRLARAFLSFMQAEWEIPFGSAVRAEAASREALAHFQDFISVEISVSVRGVIASSLILQGRLDDADAMFAGLPPDAELEGRFMGINALVTRGELRLAQGRTAEAVADLRDVRERLSAYGWERFTRGFPIVNLSRALLASGEREEAVAMAEGEIASARKRGSSRDEAASLVTIAHTMDDDRKALEVFEAAVEASRSTQTRWVTAHALTEFGAALRRAGKREAARPSLREAAEIAESVDAKAIQARATDELVVAGGKPRREITSGVESLTPAELRAAEHAADGMSNREIAETLFVTVKTIELHLGRCYSKLDIKSRAQLAGALAQAG